MKYRIIIFIKILIIILISLYIDIHIYETNEDEHSLGYYISYSTCKFLTFKINNNCSNNIFIDSNFHEDIVDIIQNINLFINIKLTKIENIFLLIGIIPFLKNNSIITYKINNKDINKLFKIIFKEKKIKDKIIKLNENDFQYFTEQFNDFLNYKWELIPKKTILNNIRSIINSYYNESCLEIFDKSLNLNFKYFIQNKRKKFSLENINDLMSKFFLNIIFFLNRKYWYL